MTVLVTGATGTIGSELVRLLSGNGHLVRAFSRSAEKISALSLPEVEAFPGNFAEEDRLKAAHEGVEVLVLITPSAPDAADHARACIYAARLAGVRKVVRLSAIKAETGGPTENTRLHALTEAEIRESGMDHVFLRPNFFMQNLFMVAETIKAKGTFSFANGDGRTGLIDTRDVALCLRHCVESDRWNGAAHELTGPEAISLQEAAERLSALLGKPVRYDPVRPQDAHDFALTSGWGPWLAALLRDYGAAYSSGWGDFVTGQVEKITGQPARRFEDFAEDLLLPVLRT
ncbi:SDR family oxidoreductase [Roseibium sp.]|uniref:SDR family oxidoreductase n=1 Tax=Roseibium sp. TaxID=1936156 RepID=UPI003D0D56C2